MSTGWYPLGRHHPRVVGPHRGTEGTASSPRGVVLLMDRDGVYVEPVTLRQRIESHLLADRLDQALASGTAPESDVLLALRAQHLVCPTTRWDLAVALERLLRLAAEPDHGVRRTGSVAVLSRVAAARSDIETLVEHLLAPVPVPVRGLALVRVLLRDGRGPLFRYESTDDLALQVRRASDALDPGLDWPA